MRAVLRGIQDFTNEDAERWNSALDVGKVKSPFLSYAFCHAVHCARGGVRILEITDDNKAVAYLPFQLRGGRALLRHAEQVGGSMSDYFGIVGNLGEPLNPDWILNAARLSSLRFDRAALELTPFEFLEGEEQVCVRVNADNFESPVEAIARKDKDFVKSVTRSERQIARDHGDIKFALNTTNSAVELEKLIVVKRNQYRRTGTTDVLRPLWKRAVLSELLQERTSSQCRPLLSTLYCGDKWVAANFALRCDDTLHICYPAYDPRFRRYSPGHILFFKIFEEGVKQGINKFDFGPGDATYKLKYRGQFYSLSKGVIRRRSILGYSERVLQSCEWRAKGFLTPLRKLARGGFISAS